MRWRGWAAVVTAVLAVAGGCAQPAPVGPPVAAAGAAGAPAGPSARAQMVCSQEAQDDIGVLLGVTPTQVGPLQYAAGTASCRYRYGDGAFDLSVQDLPDGAAATAAVDALAAGLGRAGPLDLPGATAFTTAAGSVVLRKDDTVMTVDVTGLPARFGRPPVSRGDAALLITKAILSCWTG